MLHIGLLQPEIPQNVGALIRFAGCLGVKLHIIGPLSFLWDPKKLRRTAMDYLNHCQYKVYDNWSTFKEIMGEQTILRTVALAPRLGESIANFTFARGDILIAGSEQGGIPQPILEDMDARVHIPMIAQVRSLNVSTALSFGTALALDRLRAFPNP